MEIEIGDSPEPLERAARAASSQGAGSCVGCEEPHHGLLGTGIARVEAPKPLAQTAPLSFAECEVVFAQKRREVVVAEAQQ